jgi:SAM-dependent methyltransferase
VPSDKIWDAKAYAANAPFVPALGAAVIDWLAPRAGESVLDLGCGDGSLTLKLLAEGCAVVGVDSSPAMVEAARARGIEAYVADGQALPFENRFDAVFTNAALHWMLDHDAVIASVKRALKPGGRFVGECGGFGNVDHICNAMRAVFARRGITESWVVPWHFASDSEFAARLTKAGFSVERISLFPRPTDLSTGIEGWLRTFSDGILAHLPEADREPALAEMIALCEPHLKKPDGVWFADYVRLRFAARLK